MWKESQWGKSGSMKDFSMQMDTARTAGRSGALLVSLDFVLNEQTYEQNRS